MTKIWIFQYKDKKDPKLFRSWSTVSDNFNPQDYECVYSTNNIELGVPTENILNNIFETLNNNRPTDYSEHSLSVSDVVLLSGERTGCYYVDSFGWADLKNYIHNFQELRTN